MPATLEECPPARLDSAPALDDATAGTWSLLFTKGQREKRLAFQLYREGIDFFLPLSERVKRDAWRHRTVTIEPLFKNYVFIRGNEDTIGRALATQHIYRVIRVPNQTKLRSDLANLERAIALNPRIEAASEIVLGRRVRVVEGPFQGLVGKAVKRGKDTLMVVEVEGCGIAVLEIDSGKLEPFG